MVSAVHVGDPAQKVKGGIGYSKKKRRYFVWEFAPSFVVRFPLNGFSDELEDGPTVKLYLGGVPKEIEPSLHFEP